MKRITGLLVLSLILHSDLLATDMFWVGPSNGNWNNSNNWSATSAGPGGFGVPGAADSVIINPGALVNIDMSPTVKSLGIINTKGGDLADYVVKLYTASGCVLTILENLTISAANLTDSTSENVPFNLVLNGATHATGNITNGSLTFIGRVPVSGGGGATLTTEPGSTFTVKSYSAVYSRSNSAYITSDPASLNFSLQSRYVISSNLDAAIPDATFENDFVIFAPYPTPPEYYITIPGASIYIQGKMGRLKYPNATVHFRSLGVNLPEQTDDVSLALPDGSSIKLLGVGSTNGHTLTLLANTSSSSRVSVSIGNFSVGGDNTKVAMANATNATAATDYFIQALFFTQTGGNFSLQDFDGAVGSSTLAVSRDCTQTGGTFITNSTAADAAAKFVLEMNGGDFYYYKPYGNDSRDSHLP